MILRHKPGDKVSFSYVDRNGASKQVMMTPAENPHLEIVAAPFMVAGAARAFRDAWLHVRANRTPGASFQSGASASFTDRTR